MQHLYSRRYLICSESPFPISLARPNHLEAGNIYTINLRATEVADQDVSGLQSELCLWLALRRFGIMLLLRRRQVEQNDHAVWFSAVLGPQADGQQNLKTKQDCQPE